MESLAGCVNVGSKIPYYCLYLYGTVKLFTFSDLAGFDLGFYKKVDVFLHPRIAFSLVSH